MSVWLLNSGSPRTVRATAARFAAGRRQVSLVGWLSFEVMRDRRIRHAFTDDQHFAEQGFLPA